MASDVFIHLRVRSPHVNVYEQRKHVTVLLSVTAIYLPDLPSSNLRDLVNGSPTIVEHIRNPGRRQVRSL